MLATFDPVDSTAAENRTLATTGRRNRHAARASNVYAF